MGGPLCGGISYIIEQGALDTSTQKIVMETPIWRWQLVGDPHGRIMEPVMKGMCVVGSNLMTSMESRVKGTHRRWDRETSQIEGKGLVR